MSYKNNCKGWDRKMYEIYIDDGWNQIVLATVQGKAEAKREQKKLQKKHPEFMLGIRKCNP